MNEMINQLREENEQLRGFKEKIGPLLAEIEKLNGYHTQHFSRLAKIDDALGLPGTRHLTKIYQIADEVKNG